MELTGQLEKYEKEDKKQTKSINCIKFLTEKLSLAMNALYVRKNFDHQKNKAVQIIFDNLFRSFRRNLKAASLFHYYSKHTELDAHLYT